MNDQQIWQTIALDLKRAANYLHAGREKQAKYYLDEARDLYKIVKVENKFLKIKRFIKFEGHPEDILLGSSIIMSRL